MQTLNKEYNCNAKFVSTIYRFLALLQHRCNSKKKSHDFFGRKKFLVCSYTIWSWFINTKCSSDVFHEKYQSYRFEEEKTARISSYGDEDVESLLLLWGEEWCQYCVSPWPMSIIAPDSKFGSWFFWMNDIRTEFW